MHAPLKDGAYEVAGYEHKGCGIGPDQGDVGKAQGPGTEEGVIVAENVPGIGKDAAFIGIVAHHEREVGGDDEDECCAQDHGDGGPQGACRRQEGRARHDKGAPADNAAEGKGPCVKT